MKKGNFVMRSEKFYTCGKCGNKGKPGEAHNARTCGKLQHIMKTKTNIPPLTPLFKPAQTDTNTIEGGAEMLKTLTEGLENSNPSDPKLNRSHVGYTLEELETMWFLTSEQLGYKASSQNGQKNSPPPSLWWEDKEREVIFNFVNNVHAAEPSTSVTVWREFFNKFHPKVVFRLVEDYQPETRLGDKILPPNLFYVFAENSYMKLKENHMKLKENLAGLPNIPLPVAESLINEKTTAGIRPSYRLCIALANNPTSPPMLLKKLADDMWLHVKLGKDTCWKNREKRNLLQCSLGRNANTPTVVLRTILLSGEPAAVLAAYSNPNSPSDIVKNRWKKYMENLKTEETDNGTSRTTVWALMKKSIESLKIEESDNAVSRTAIWALAKSPHISDQEVHKYVDFEIQKIAKRNAKIPPEKWSSHVDNSLLGIYETRNTFTAQKIEEHYKLLGGKNAAQITLIARLVNNPNVPQHIIDENVERLKSLPPGLGSVILSEALLKAQQRKKNNPQTHT